MIGLGGIDAMLQAQSLRVRRFALTRWWVIVPGTCFLGAFILRVWAVGWGLPYVEHPDEPALVEVAVRMVRTGDLNPHSFRYPSLVFYLLAAVIRVHAWWGMHAGIYATLNDLPTKTYGFTPSSTLYLWCRVLIALLGAATVPVLYHLGQRMFNRRVGLLGALALALSVFHIEHSHYITTDASTGLWVTLALVGAWMVATTGHWRSYLLAGTAAGLATGTKYNAGVIVLVIIAAHLMYWRHKSVGWAGLRLIACGAVTLLVFLATTPYALLDPAHVASGLRFNANHYASGDHGDFTGAWPVAEYARFLWNRHLFPVGCIVLLLGMPRLIWRYPRQLTLLLLAVGAEFGLLLPQNVHFLRNLLTIFPLFMLLVGASAITLADWLPHLWSRWSALAGLALLLLWPQAQATAWLLHYWEQPYTLNAAADQLRTLQGGSLAAVEMNPVQWAGDPTVLPVEHLTDHPAQWYRERGIRYLVANSDQRTSRNKTRYQQLVAAAQVIARYPERREGIQPGPGVTILDLGLHPEEMPFVRSPIQFDSFALLQGYEMRPGPLRARIEALNGANKQSLNSGDSLQITLYWQALAPIDQDYTLFIHVLNERGERVAQRDNLLRADDYPTTRWHAGEWVIDRADLVLPSLPQGTYSLAIGLYDAATGTRLASQDKRASIGHPVDTPVLTTFQIH